jgi:hypothetical protein
MIPAIDDLARRRPVWIALSDLFADSELSYQTIASTVAMSGYTVDEIETILWSEVFPAAEFNFGSPVPISAFDPDKLEESILERAQTKGDTCPVDSRTRRVIEKEWSQVCVHLKDVGAR